MTFERLTTGQIVGVNLTTAGSTTANFTTPGVSIAEDVKQFKYHTFALTVANIDTNVKVRVEGTIETAGNSNWFNMNDTGLDTTITTAGTHLLHKPNFKCQFVRFRFVSETGGAGATITAKYMGGS